MIEQDLLMDVNNQASYTRTSGYCKNNSPTNSYDVTDASNSNCS